jgi:hypothetical protein
VRIFFQILIANYPEEVECMCFLWFDIHVKFRWHSKIVLKLTMYFSEWCPLIQLNIFTNGRILYIYTPKCHARTSHSRKSYLDCSHYAWQNTKWRNFTADYNSQHFELDDGWAFLCAVTKIYSYLWHSHLSVLCRMSLRKFKIELMLIRATKWGEYVYIATA